MLAELSAVRDLLRATYGTKVTVGIGDMTGHQAPFVSVWGPPAGRGSDEAVGGPCGDLEARIGCTFTAARTDAALALAEDGIEALTPGRMPAFIAAGDRVLQVSFFDAQNATVDRTVTLPGTNTHPAYVVALFRLTTHS